MTNHIEVKHKIQRLGKTKFKMILDETMLNEKEQEMMLMYYIDKKPIDYIADILGYSEQGILKMHKRILDKIEPLL
jgi:DNA-directed RNA polymerase specialized sigma subunit